MRGNYSDGFKEQAIAKVFARSGDQTLVSIAADLNITLGTLRSWIRIAMRDQKKLPVKSKRAADYTLAERLLALHESHGLEAEELNAWCRERGVFAHDLTQWRSSFCGADGVGSAREESEELRQLRLTNAQLQRELNRKEKALAEAGALLVLQKKYRALWAAEDV